MTQAEIERQVKALMTRFDDLNTFYIQKVASQIATIGELSASALNVISVMASMYEDIAEINMRLAQAARLTMPELYSVYNRALNDVYHDGRFERALKETPLPDANKRQLEQYTQAVSRQTANALQNLSNTTAVAQTYRQTVDKAVLAVSSGLGDYGSAMRKSLRELGSNGLQVEYASGYRRRLDSAIRQNIVDGVKQINQHSSDMIGEALGFDAKEITAHVNSAPDHEPVQGHVFLNAEFENLQTEHAAKDVDGRFFPAMKRPIGEWNCMHFAYPFSTKYSKRKYTNEQLDQWAVDNANGCEIDGKHYTNYEASQLMRKIETEIRRQKDIGVAAEAAGDDTLRQEAQRNIRALTDRYKQVANASGLNERRERMRVEGFHAVRIKRASKTA